MNESQIREFAEQADILFYQGRVPETGFEYEGAEVTVEDLKKFAEMIVQECLLAISKTEVTLEEMSVMVKCHNQVEKHFGIE